jgi:hypothetical protein
MATTSTAVGLRGAHVAGGSRLAPALRALGVREGAATDGLVYDASEAAPATWPELEDLFADVFRLSQAAVTQHAPIVYVLHEPSLHGHGPALRAMLAAGLLGASRSLAVEGRRHGAPANAVALGSEEEVRQAADTVSWLLANPGVTGQLITCGSTHLARPAA